MVSTHFLDLHCSIQQKLELLICYYKNGSDFCRENADYESIYWQDFLRRRDFFLFCDPGGVFWAIMKTITVV